MRFCANEEWRHQSRPGLRGHAYCTAWLHSDVLSQFGVLVLNAGAHSRSDASFAAGIRITVNALKAYPDIKIMFRTTAAGYSGCEHHFSDQPFATFDEAEAFMHAHPYYDSLSFHRQNNMAADMFRAAHFMVLIPSMLCFYDTATSFCVQVCHRFVSVLFL